MSDPGKQRVEAEILDIIDRGGDNNFIQTKGGLKFRTNSINGIEKCLLKPVTDEGRVTLRKAILSFKDRMPGKDYEPVTTLAVDSSPAAGGKRNKSKKPKRRNSRSKRRKTVSKRRR